MVTQPIEAIKIKDPFICCTQIKGLVKKDEFYEQTPLLITDFLFESSATIEEETVLII
ncbi:hypothetical protein D3C80_1930650 [compost metagenome]